MKVSKEEILSLIRKAIRDEKVKDKKEKLLDKDSIDNPTEQNKYHSSTGEFTDKANSTCDSRYFSGGKRKSTKSSLTNPSDTGRGKRKDRGKGKYRCRDNKALWERLEQLVKEIVVEVVSEGTDPEAEQARKKKRMIKGCRQLGLRTFQETLAIINSIQKAEKGELYGQK
jgi:hypothetical protein